MPLLKGVKGLARPKKETVDYFPHYLTSNSRTIFILENAYGNDGYCFWFKLLEMLGGTKGHWLDVSSVTDLEFLAAKCKVGKEQTVEILNKLAELEAIDHELWDDANVVWCQNFVDNLSDLYTRRKIPVPKRPVPESFKNTGPTPIEEPTVSNSCIDDEVKKAISTYENEVGLISPTIYDSIRFYISEGIEADLIIKAIEISVKNNKRRFSYCEGIIKNWIKEGIKTLKHYQVEEKNKAQEGNVSGGNSSNNQEIVRSEAERIQLGRARELGGDNREEEELEF